MSHQRRLPEVMGRPSRFSSHSALLKQSGSSRPATSNSNQMPALRPASWILSTTGFMPCGNAVALTSHLPKRLAASKAWSSNQPASMTKYSTPSALTASSCSVTLRSVGVPQVEQNSLKITGR